MGAWLIYISVELFRVFISFKQINSKAIKLRITFTKFILGDVSIFKLEKPGSKVQVVIRSRGVFGFLITPSLGKVTSASIMQYKRSQLFLLPLIYFLFEKIIFFYDCLIGSHLIITSSYCHFKHTFVPTLFSFLHGDGCYIQFPNDSWQVNESECIKLFS